MAWQVKFLSHSTNLNVTQEPASSQEVRTYLAYEDDPAYSGATDTTWTIYALAKGTSAPWSTIPKVGQRLYPGSADLNARQLLVDSVEVEAVADRANTWRVVVRSSAPLVGNTGFANVKVQYQQRQRVLDVYVDTATLPTDGDTAEPPTSLISGTVVNVMGDPLKITITQAAITVEATYNSVADVGSYWMTTMPSPNDLLNKAFTRNSQAWLNYQVGTVLFVGYEERELSPQVTQSSWNFLYDNAYHLLQVPFRRPTDGSLWLDTLYNWGGGGNQARGTSKAAWRQPYRKTKIDFGSAGVLFPQEVITAMNTPTPAW